MKLTRRERPPESLLARLDKHERVLSWADGDGGTVVAASPRGVWWPGDSDASGPRLIEWHFVDKVIWRDNRLVLVQADIVDDTLLVDRPPVAMLLTRPRDLPPTLRKRVEANIVGRELLQFDGGAVRFVARRRSGHDGATWWAHLEPGTRDSEALRSAVRARLAILRSA